MRQCIYCRYFVWLLLCFVFIFIVKDRVQPIWRIGIKVKSSLCLTFRRSIYCTLFLLWFIAKREKICSLRTKKKKRCLAEKFMQYICLFYFHLSKFCLPHWKPSPPYVKRLQTANQQRITRKKQTVKKNITTEKLLHYLLCIPPQKSQLNTMFENFIFSPVLLNTVVYPLSFYFRMLAFCRRPFFDNFYTNWFVRIEHFAFSTSIPNDLYIRCLFISILYS